MSHDCIVGSSVQLIEVNTIEVFFSVMTERTSGGQGRDSGEKKFFWRPSSPPYVRVWMNGGGGGGV